MLLNRLIAMVYGFIISIAAGAEAQIVVETEVFEVDYHYPSVASFTHDSWPAYYV